MSHPLPPDLGAGWSAEPTALVGLALTAGLYATGWGRLARRARGRAGLPPWRAWCFAGGLGAVALATLSPLHAWSERLFTAHMVQHLLLLMAAAPLVWLGAPLVPVLWGLPRGGRRAVGRLLVRGHPVQRLAHALARPWLAATLGTVTVAVWHWPPLYDAAQGRSVVHDLEHALFLGTSLLYWWPLVHPAPGRRPLAAGPALLYLVPPMVAGDAIGAVLSIAQAPLYATYGDLVDQQIGGLVMWVGGGLLWLAAMACALFLLPSGGQEPPRTGPVRRLGPASMPVG